jgi:hypothetical protein
LSVNRYCSGSNVGWVVSSSRDFNFVELKQETRLPTQSNYSCHKQAPAEMACEHRRSPGHVHSVSKKGHEDSSLITMICKEPN